LPGATSAVMELCVDNPREGFGELFDTHPTVDNRVEALVKYAGGHDCGPIALEASEPGADEGAAAASDQPAPAGGPWGSAADADAPPAGPSDGPPPPDQASGPWGPHGR
jgi:heat shock protein HtpX